MPFAISPKPYTIFIMKLLLHICCAPCAVAITDTLMNRPEMALEGIYYNPNIHPSVEFQKRRDTVKTMAVDYSLPVAYKDAYMLDYWKNNLNCSKEIRNQWQW